MKQMQISDLAHFILILNFILDFMVQDSVSSAVFFFMKQRINSESKFLVNHCKYLLLRYLILLT